jgi:hypothetical protein
LQPIRSAFPSAKSGHLLSILASQSSTGDLEPLWITRLWVARIIRTFVFAARTTDDISTDGNSHCLDVCPHLLDAFERNSLILLGNLAP